MMKIRRNGISDKIPPAPPLAGEFPPAVPSAHAIDSINIECVPSIYDNFHDMEYVECVFRPKPSTGLSTGLDCDKIRHEMRRTSSPLRLSAFVASAQKSTKGCGSCSGVLPAFP